MLLKGVDLFVDDSHLLDNNREFSLLLLGGCLGKIGSILEWLDLLENVVIDNDVDNPGTEESGGLGLTHHHLFAEELLSHDWLEHFKLPLINVVTVKGLDIFDELLWIVHHLRSITPSVVLLLTFE